MAFLLYNRKQHQSGLSFLLTSVSGKSAEMNRA